LTVEQAQQLIQINSYVDNLGGFRDGLKNLKMTKKIPENSQNFSVC
jgi:hypothetical protein